MRVAMPFLATQREATYAIYFNLITNHRCPEFIYSLPSG
jgi:hypothetical protein